MEEIDQIMKKKDFSKKPRKHSNPTAKKKEPHPNEIPTNDLKSKLDSLNVGIKDGDPEIYNPVMLSEESGTPKSMILRGGLR